MVEFAKRTDRVTNMEIDASRLIWEFFEAHPLPQELACQFSTLMTVSDTKPSGVLCEMPPR